MAKRRHRGGVADESEDGDSEVFRQAVERIASSEASIRSLEQQVSTLMAQNQWLRSQIDARASNEARAQAFAAAVGVQRAAAQSSTMVDPRGIGKPAVLKGNSDFTT